MPLDRALVGTCIDNTLEFGLFRLSDNPRVLVHLSIVEGSGKQFDSNRLAVIWIDGLAEFDLCISKAFYELEESLGLSPEKVSLSLEDESVILEVWHGNKDEGTGVIGKLIEAEKVLIRVYFSDYSIQDFQIETNELAKMTEVLKRDFLGVE